MAERFSQLSDHLIEFIRRQHLYFVSTACDTGRINLSPKGMDSLRVLDQNRVAWLNLTGSGNETAAHIQVDDRMTLMFCSFDTKPLILRLYGQAKVIHPRDTDWNTMTQLFPEYMAARQIFDMQVELVQTSCGFGIPRYDLGTERDALLKWAEQKGKAGITEYWNERNSQSIDGLDTGILAAPND